jgi:hypothetical protein
VEDEAVQWYTPITRGGNMSGKRQKPTSVEDAAIPKRPIDSELSETEKQDLIDQVEEFEGPDRREIRGQKPKKPHVPGVSHS